MDNGKAKSAPGTHASLLEAFIFISVLDIIAVIYMMALYGALEALPVGLSMLFSPSGDPLDMLMDLGLSLYGLWMILSIPRCVIAIILAAKRKRIPYSLLLAVFALFIDAYWIAIPNLLRQPY